MATRRSASAASEKSPVSQWVMITQESNLEVQRDTNARSTLRRLRHPKTGAAAMYMFSDANQKIHEVMTFDEEGRRSWFIGNTVQSDGSMIVTTPVDPVFLVLPYLALASKSGKFMSLDCLLADEDYADCRYLSTCCSTDGLSRVADVKGDADYSAFRYNSEKTLTWLKEKVNRLVAALKQHNISVDGSSSANYVKGKKCSELDEDVYIHYACGMISDYLSTELAQQLADSLGVKDNVENYSTDHLPALKKAKTEPLAPTEDWSVHGENTNTTSKKAEKLTIAQKRLSKVDKTGMKSISAFFGAKTAGK